MVEEGLVRRAAPEPHFLVVTFPAQGHINPARHLARRLLRATGARVTVCTAVSALRKMFPGAEADAEEEGHRDGAGVRYVPYSDGYDDGFDGAVHDATRYMDQVKVVGSRTLGDVLARLRGAGRPATLVVYTLLLSWVADVARARSVPAALYWIQPATVLAVYLHFFRATDGVDRAIAAAGADASDGFGTTGAVDIRKREVAAFLAEPAHRTSGGWDGAPNGTYAWGFCYKPAGAQNVTDPVAFFETAIASWMTASARPPKPSCHDVVTEQWTPSDADKAAGRLRGFGVIANIINGDAECGRGPDAGGQDRIGFYKRFCDILGVSYGDNLDCFDQKPFGAATAAALAETTSGPRHADA